MPATSRSAFPAGQNASSVPCRTRAGVSIRWSAAEASWRALAIRWPRRAAWSGDRVRGEPAGAVLRAVGRRARARAERVERDRAVARGEGGAHRVPPMPGVRLPGQQQERLAVTDDVVVDA